MTLIINNRNVWQPPIAKHCPITALPLTTTTTHPTTAAVPAAPRKCPHGPSEGTFIANPSMCPSPHRGMWASNTPRHRPSPPATSLIANGDPRLPRHQYHSPRTPRHRCHRLPPAPSPPKHSAYATSRTTTTPTRYVTANDKRAHHVTTANDARRPNRRVGARRIGKGSEEERGRGERGGKGRRDEDAEKPRVKEGACTAPSFFVFHPRSQRGGVKTTRRLVRALCFDRGECCPPVSFHFERGRYSHRPRFFLSVSIGGHAAPHFLSF